MFELSSNEHLQRSQTSYEILLIEDDEDTGLMLTEYIESESSFRVKTLPSGEAMLQHLQEQNETMPSVFIIDYLLPGMSGLQLLDHLKSLKMFKQVPTILITAATLTNDMRTVLQDRNITLITKPLDLTELMYYLDYIRNHSFQQLI